MVHRMQDEEALRWKRKFLDALEEHELREKALGNRIRLLRRGLLGISLAGDGNDSLLDKQLAELRQCLRNDDREIGLELLLEQIEKTIVRLDTEKNQSTLALQQAFNGAIAELQQVPLPGSTRRQLKKFSRSLSGRIEDPQQHAGLIRQFVDLLRLAVAELRQLEAESPDGSSQALAIERGGFWRRVLGAGKARRVAPKPAVPDDTEAPAVVRRPPPAEMDSADLNLEDVVDDSVDDTATARQSESVVDAATDAEADEGQELPLAEEFSPTPDISVEGELIRDKSGLAEPAFSYIAGHVEPLLLRILESIHISGESLALAESVRRHIVKGLNWYDFVAVLEEILQVLRNAANDQRNEFQEFLSDVTESLAQVQAFVESSRKNADDISASDAELDASVREQISGIASSVEDDDADLDALKQSVQTQIGVIIKSLDGFREQRSRQAETMSQDMAELVARIASLEEESRELRTHLAQQQENSMRDSLTELPNRDAYNQRLKALLHEWQHGASHDRRADDRALCLAVADVDSFKNINDTYGHLAGDKVLKIIAREFVSRLRDKDFVARYGGEEFVIILPDTRPADAEHVLNKLRQAIANIPFHFKEKQIVITVSFGVVAASNEDTPESLFESADRALYQAKEDGRNRVHRVR